MDSVERHRACGWVASKSDQAGHELELEVGSGALTGKLACASIPLTASNGFRNPCVHTASRSHRKGALYRTVYSIIVPCLQVKLQTAPETMGREQMAGAARSGVGDAGQDTYLPVLPGRASKVVIVISTGMHPYP